MPSKEQIENEISSYVDNSLIFCLNNFETFANLNISSGEIRTQTKINDDGILFNVDFPITIQKGEAKNIIKDFKHIKVLGNLELVYDSVEKIILSQMSNENICVSCISEIASENELIINLENTDEGLLFEVRDENFYLKGVPLIFKFANKYKTE